MFDILIHYNFEIQHCKDKENTFTDELSRRLNLIIKKIIKIIIFRRNLRIRHIIINVSQFIDTILIKAEKYKEQLLQQIQEIMIKNVTV